MEEVNTNAGEQKPATEEVNGQKQVTEEQVTEQEEVTDAEFIKSVSGGLLDILVAWAEKTDDAVLTSALRLAFEVVKTYEKITDEEAREIIECMGQLANEMVDQPVLAPALRRRLEQIRDLGTEPAPEPSGPRNGWRSLIGRSIELLELPDTLPESCRHIHQIVSVVEDVDQQPSVVHVQLADCMDMAESWGTYLAEVAAVIARDYAECLSTLRADGDLLAAMREGFNEKLSAGQPK